MSISEFSIKRPVAATMILVSMVMLGTGCNGNNGNGTAA